MVVGDLLTRGDSTNKTEIELRNQRDKNGFMLMEKMPPGRYYHRRVFV